MSILLTNCCYAGVVVFSTISDIFFSGISLTAAKRGFAHFGETGVYLNPWFVALQDIKFVHTPNF